MNAAAEQVAIAEEFALFADWAERYQYLIDLGKSLPKFPSELRTEEHLLKGCQSQVFVHVENKEDVVHVQAISDSSIVSGLIALVLRVYSGRSKAEVLATEPSFIEAIGLSKNLSMTRKNGLSALIARIKQSAQSD
jgi:cysteine desulfuration protein SufE